MNTDQARGGSGGSRESVVVSAARTQLAVVVAAWKIPISGDLDKEM